MAISFGVGEQSCVVVETNTGDSDGNPDMRRAGFGSVLSAFVEMPAGAAVWCIDPYGTGVLTSVTLGEVSVSRFFASGVMCALGVLTAIVPSRT